MSSIFSTSSSASDEEDSFSTNAENATIDPTRRTLFTCAWSECCVAGKLHGCIFPGVQSNDKCSHVGCDSESFHHCCQTDWEMAQYLHDFPGGDPGQCRYESGTNGSKHCMKHHSFGHLAAYCPIPSSAKEDNTTAKTNAAGKVSAADKKKKLQEFIDKQTLDNIVLTNDKKDVATLAGIPWTNLTVDMKKSFMKDNNIVTPQTMRTNNHLGKVVANHLNSVDITISVASTAAKKKNAEGIPACITQMTGTMIRVINTIVGCQAAYKATKGSHDREDQDTHRPKIAAWEALSQYYNSNEETLDEIDPTIAHKLVGCDIPSDAGHYYDTLNPDEIKEVINYLNAHYRIARNSKTTLSGCHDGLAAHVRGKKWLLYYDYLLQEEPNADLGTFAFPTLPSGVVRTSTDVVGSQLKRRKVRQNSSSASDRSMSTPGSGDTTTAAGATISAMEAVQVRMNGLKESEDFMRRVQGTAELARLKSDINKLRAQYNKLGSEYLVAKKAKDRRKMKEVQNERNGLKSERMMSEKNYTEMKATLGYESPECSSASSPSESEDMNDDSE